MSVDLARGGHGDLKNSFKGLSGAGKLDCAGELSDVRKWRL